MKTVMLSLLFVVSTVSALAAETKWTMSLNEIPFKTCKGRSNQSVDPSATVTVAFNKNSIQVIDKSGKKQIYASQSQLCGTDLSDIEVNCKTQETGISANGQSYILKKECNAAVSGVPNRFIFYRVDLDMALNIYELDGRKSATGFLSCVVNNDGFHGLELYECK